MDCLYCALRALSIACSPVLQLCRAAPAAPGTRLLYHALAGTILVVNHPAAHALPAPCTVPCLSPCVPCAACSTGMALLRVPPCIRCLHHHCLHQALPAAPCSTLHRVLPAPSIACSGVLSSEPCPPFHAMPCFALLLPFAPCIWVLSPPVLLEVFCRELGSLGAGAFWHKHGLQGKHHLCILICKSRIMTWRRWE